VPEKLSTAGTERWLEAFAQPTGIGIRKGKAVKNMTLLHGLSNFQSHTPISAWKAASQ